MIQLQIKKHYADQILSGEKTKDFRDNTDYYAKLFVNDFDGENPTIKEIKQIKFVNGYSKDRLEFVCEIESIEFMNQLDEFDNETNCFFYQINISRIISTNL